MPSKDLAHAVKWKRFDRMAAPGNRRRFEQRVDDCLFSRFYDRLKQRRHRLVPKHRHLARLRRTLWNDAQLRGSRKGNDKIAAAVCGGRTGARETHYGSSCEPLQVAGVQRRIGSNHDHAGTAGIFAMATPPICGHNWIARATAQLTARLAQLNLVTQVVVSKLFSDGSTRDAEDAAEVGLYQDSHGVGTEQLRQLAGGRADSALEAKRNCSGARTY